MRRKIGTAICLALCCTMKVSLASESGAVPGKSIVYADAGHTYLEAFVRDEANVLWWLSGAAGRSRDTFEHFTSEPLHDCSDVDYRCIYGMFRVFAVPRNGLTEQSSYSAGGAAFRVEKCLRSSKTRCLQALIGSDCQSRMQPDRCAPVVGGRANSTLPGPVIYFVFKEKIGVTAYGDGEPSVLVATQLASAKKLRLSGRRGLLSVEGLPTAN